jgi:hypothetical protein
MADNNQLSCLAKRDLLNEQSASVEVLLSWAQRFVELELLPDAVDFYEKAGVKDQLRELLKVVQEEGDAFLFKRINRCLGREPEQREWLLLAGYAEQMGKEAFAAEALRQAGMEESAGAISAKT